MVHIVKNNPWKNIQNHKDLITRCFNFIYYKKVSPGNPKDAYQNVLYLLAQKDVFCKFNPEKTKKNPEKALEMFIFNAIEMMLYHEYIALNRKELLTNHPYNDSNPNHRTDYPEDYRELYENEQKSLNFSIRRTDPSKIISEYHSNSSTDQNAVYKDQIKHVYSKCNSDLEKKIMKYKMMGYSIKEIAEITGEKFNKIRCTLTSMKNKLKKSLV